MAVIRFPPRLAGEPRAAPPASMGRRPLSDARPHLMAQNGCKWWGSGGARSSLEKARHGQLRSNTRHGKLANCTRDGSSPPPPPARLFRWTPQAHTEAPQMGSLGGSSVGRQAAGKLLADQPKWPLARSPSLMTVVVCKFIGHSTTRRIKLHDNIRFWLVLRAA